MIIQGDFRSTNIAEKADAIITDPPYNIGHNYGSVSDNLKGGRYEEMMQTFGMWSYQNTVEDAYLAVVHYPEFFFMHGRECFTDQGWAILQRIPHRGADERDALRRSDHSRTKMLRQDLITCSVVPFARLRSCLPTSL